MNILITGGTGFLGSTLVKRLINEGHSLTLILREKSVMNRWRLKAVEGRFDFFLKESQNYDSHFEKSGGFDAIIHCATNYGRKGVLLAEVLEDNLIWPVKLLELGVKYGCSFFVNTDTFFTKKYADYGYLKEYTLSKFLFRETLLSYSSVINIANLRLEHVYGPDDSPDKFASWITTQLLKNVSSLELTAGTQKRDFIYVEDVVSAFTFLLKYKESIVGFEEYEVGTGDSHSIREFVEMIKQLMNSTTELSWGALPLRRNEFPDSKADISKLKDLGWKPMFSFEDGIKFFVDYYRN